MRTELSRPASGAAPSARASPPLPPPIPELEADYELLRELGRGSTAVVYLARERALARYVAIKLIRPLHIQDEDAVVRLEREARTVARLQHPNVVMLLGARRLAEGGVALVLQYVPGSTLRQHLRERGTALPFSDVETILHDLGRALAYVHHQGVVHRDVKPENIHLDAEARVARLSDFGIAQVPDGTSMTIAGTALGTPSYMSPEQVDGQDLDGRSDLYSLGMVGWEMVAGRHPWAGEPLYSVLHKQKHEVPPPLDSVRPDVPPSLCAAIEKALTKDPDARWGSAEEFLEALRGGQTTPWQPSPAGDAAGETEATLGTPVEVEDAPTVVLSLPPAGRGEETAEPSHTPPLSVPAWVLELDMGDPHPPAGPLGKVGRGLGRARTWVGQGAKGSWRAAVWTAREARALAVLSWGVAASLAPHVLPALRELARAFRAAGRAVFAPIPHLGELGQLALLVFAVAVLLAVLGRPTAGPAAASAEVEGATTSVADGASPGVVEGPEPEGSVEAVWPQPGVGEVLRVHVIRSWYRVRATAREVGRDLSTAAAELWQFFRRLLGPSPIRAELPARGHDREGVWAWQRA